MKFWDFMLRAVVVLVMMGVAYKVFTSLDEENRLLRESYSKKCIDEYNITNADLIYDCAWGKRSQDPLNNTGSIDMRGVVLVIAGAVVMSAILPWVGYAYKE